MPIILFDGFCNLCDYAIQFLIRHDTDKQLKFISMQSEMGKKLLQAYAIPPSIQSVVLIKEKQVYLKSDAIIQSCSLLSGWPSYLRFTAVIPRVFRNWIYDGVARYRYKLFGKKQVCK